MTDLRITFARDQVAGFWVRAQQIKADLEDCRDPNEIARLKVEYLRWARRAEQARCKLAGLQSYLSKHVRTA